MTPVIQPSRYAAERHLFDLEQALEAIRDNRVPNWTSIAWPAGLDRTILGELPLEVRTRNCLEGAQLMEGEDALAVKEFLRLPNFGRKSLSDLLLKVEGFLKECVLTERSGLSQAGELSTAQATPGAWERAGELLRPLLAAVGELQEVRTLADALNPDVLLLATRMGISTAIEEITIDDIANGSPGLAATIGRRLAETLASASESELTIIQHRLLRVPPKTLDEIGLQVGVTRERIRQLQVKIEGKIQHALGNRIQIIASTLKESFGHMAEESAVEDRLADLMPTDHPIANKLLGHALIAEMGFTLDDGVYLDQEGMETLGKIRASAQRLGDDVGLVAEGHLVAELPSEDWRQFWPWLRERCGLHDLHGSLGIRDSVKARAKAAILSIGRPATREEIAGICGLDETRIGSNLSNISSGIRADKERWGLREWIDDEYEGIVAEIIQRIDEEGGTTTTKRLLQELPSKFNVSPTSVRAYMQTPKFVIRDGWISIANSSSLQLRYLDDAIDGRDGDGDPYWTFVVEARFFDGYSVTGVPPEFAKALGCAPDGGKRLRIANLPDCPGLSLRWPLASMAGASLGYLGEPLHRLGLQPGQGARVTIREPGVVDIGEEDGSPAGSPASEADAILERMMKRRRAL